MGGISPSTVAWRAFAQVVIFLYLLEEQTSMLVLVPNAVGSLIEVCIGIITFSYLKLIIIMQSYH